MKTNYKWFGLFGFLYSVFTAFCLYRNTRGITFPFFVAATLCYFYFSMKKCGISAKKDSWFYLGSILMLGISVCFTMDERMIFIAKTGILLLLFAYLLHHFYDDSDWSLLKYLQSIAESGIYMIGSFVYPVTDLLYYLKNQKAPVIEEDGTPVRKNSTGVSVLIGFAITIPMLVIIIVLLRRADVIFMSITDQFFQMIKLKNLFEILCIIILTYIVSYSLVNSMQKREIQSSSSAHRTKDPVPAVTVTSIISLVYLLFCAIQIIFLFGKKGVLPDGYTYATYARQGFFELLWVCILNVIIVLICLSLFQENRFLKITLLLLCMCTYIMMLSSAYRMYLYVSVYHLTFLRLMVFFFLAVLAILMAGIIISVFKTNFSVFRYGMSVVTVATILLCFSRPDYLIASYNINQLQPSLMENSSDEYAFYDLDYLMNLSQDAAPILLEQSTFHLMYQNRPEAARSYYELLIEKQKKLSPRTFNISEFQSQQAMKKLNTTF